MEELPKLPVPVEHRVVRRACSLSPRASRAMFGRPTKLDGQTLTPGTHALLTLGRLSGSTCLFPGDDVEGTRAKSRREARVLARQRPISMAEVRALDVPGPDGPLPSRLYVPARTASDGPDPLLVYFHGGGWVIGDLDMYDDICRLFASASGCRVLSVGYRLAPEHPYPAPLEDAIAAFDWAVANAASLGADPKRIGVGGDSAGANMAVVIAHNSVEGEGARPAMQLLFYPVTDTAGDTRSREIFADGFILTKGDIDKFEACYLPDGVDPADQRIAVFTEGDLTGMPPAYVATAGFDPLRDEAETFARRMHDAGVRVALRRHQGLVHTFLNQTAVNPAAMGAVLEACGALRLGLTAESL